jgi:phage replication O-like protein O
MDKANQVTFQGFQFPTTTPVPDEVFDVLMPQLSGAELKVLLYICRRTFGFKKESDNISLQQIATGITTRDGRVLDRGTGLCLTSITTAISSLEQKEIIVREKNRSVEKGFEASTYSLKFAEPISKNQTGATPKNGEGVLQKMEIQQTVIQETDVVVNVAQQLQKIGIKKSTVTKLAHGYPIEYIQEKLVMVQRLVAAGSCQNAAGWLRKAIEEDYTATKPRRALTSPRITKPNKTPIPTVEPTLKEEVVANLDQGGYYQPLVGHPPPEDKNIMVNWPQRNDEANRQIWGKVVDNMKQNLPIGELERRLSATRLLRVTDTAAYIGIKDQANCIYLERHFYREILGAMKKCDS